MLPFNGDDGTKSNRGGVQTMMDMQLNVLAWAWLLTIMQRRNKEQA